jgi:hypothetical protein
VAVIACGLAPALHIVPGNGVLAERFLYLPSFGYALLVSLAVMQPSIGARWLVAALPSCCLRAVRGR